MNRKLKAKIVEKFGTQADFAQVVKIDETIVSRVVRGCEPHQSKHRNNGPMYCKPQHVSSLEAWHDKNQLKQLWAYFLRKNKIFLESGMNDTRETAYKKDMTKDNSQCRFKVGDKVLIPHNGEKIEQIPYTIFWDKEFGGWLLRCGMIGVHEQNYILANERDQWEPYENGLWSWWVKL